MRHVFAWAILVALALIAPAWALEAVRPDSSDGNIDASSATPSLSGLNVIATLAAKAARRGFVIEAQDTAGNCAGSGGANGLVVALDDGVSGTATIVTLAYATAKGGQGGAVDMMGMPHSGRIRVFGAAGCQVAAAQW